MIKHMIALGLMSGTSLDGIDISLIKSNGEDVISCNKSEYFAYDNNIQNQIRSLINNEVRSLLAIKQIEQKVTTYHIDAVLQFIKNNNINKKEIDVIGFHGQTILHNPNQNITWQIGDAQLLATKTGINVVSNFRNKDIILGGQGAPLVPIYHHKILKNHIKPLLVLNVGGVSNVTYIPDKIEKNIVAFDVCFGCAPMNDLVYKKTGRNFDESGNLAKKGHINHDLAKEFLTHSFFNKKIPKSLDRNEFKKRLDIFDNLKLEDALATFSFIIGQSILLSFSYLDQKPQEIIVCGGGRKNLSIVDNIKKLTNIRVTDIDELGYDGDFIEAQAFGFLAIRHILKLPISFPKTTGILLETHGFHSCSSKPPSSCGGVSYRA